MAVDKDFEAWSRRTHRIRLYKDPLGFYLQIRDTLEMPFEAPDFPRGELVFETSNLNEGEAIETYSCWCDRKDCHPRNEDFDLANWPAKTWRCRLYRDRRRQAKSAGFNFTEVWDTVEESHEKHGKEMPSADYELMATITHFSRKIVRVLMSQEHVRLGVAYAGAWGYHGP